METSGEERSVPQSKSGSNGWNAVELPPAASPSVSVTTPSGIDQSSGEVVRGSRLSGSMARMFSMSVCSKCHSWLAMCWTIRHWMMMVRILFTSSGWRAKASLNLSPGR